MQDAVDRAISLVSDGIADCSSGCNEGLSQEGGGTPAKVWRRSGRSDVANFHLGPWAAVQMVAAMALARAHWFADVDEQEAQARASGTSFAVTTF